MMYNCNSATEIAISDLKESEVQIHPTQKSLLSKFGPCTNIHPT